MKLLTNWKEVLDHQTNSSGNECTRLFITCWPKSLQSTWLTTWFVEWGTFPLIVMIMIRGVAIEWKLGVWMWIGYIMHELTTEVHDALSKKDILKVEFEWIWYMFRGFGSSPGFYAGINITQGKWLNLAIATASTIKHIPQKMDLLIHPISVWL